MESNHPGMGRRTSLHRIPSRHTLARNLLTSQQHTHAYKPQMASGLHRAVPQALMLLRSYSPRQALGYQWPIGVQARIPLHIFLHLCGLLPGLLVVKHADTNSIFPIFHNFHFCICVFYHQGPCGLKRQVPISAAANTAIYAVPGKLTVLRHFARY